MQRCEALTLVNGRYVPCGAQPADLHHKLTRARGGLILDAAGETYHQMYLCREHHAYAHDSAKAIAGGLLIFGSVVTGPGGAPVYTGPDIYLTQKYGKRAQVPSEVQ